MNLGWGSRK